MFIWDTANRDHILRHDISPEEVEELLDNEPLDLGRQTVRGELRYIHLGATIAGRILFVVVTLRTEIFASSRLTQLTKSYGDSMHIKKNKKQNLQIPDFKHEEDEVQWWENNQSAILKEFQEAAKVGTLGRGTLAKQGLTSPVTIRLDASDIELARAQARERGLRYQTYVKMVLHQALTKEAARSV